MRFSWLQNKKAVLLPLILGITALSWWLSSRSPTPRNVFAPQTPPTVDGSPTGEPRSEPTSDEPPVQLVETPVVIPEGMNLPELAGLRLMAPPGFTINIFASGMRKPRMLAVNQQGELMVTAMDEGVVYVLPDRDQDGVADRKVVFAKNLLRPHGIARDKDSLVIATEREVIRFWDRNADGQAEDHRVLVGNLPRGGNHVSRTLAIDAAGRLYVSVGSSCNVCRDDPRRAAILRFEPDGSGEIVFAAGLRNAVGIVLGPEGELWATDNGRDWLGDELPPEEVNIVRNGRHYGWPFCYGDRIPDPQMGIPEFCRTTESPLVSMQAHSAPLGLRFLGSESFPRSLQGDLVVAFHGSWNRSQPTGYKVVRVNLQDGRPIAVEDFINGWLLPDGTVRGRPVDLIHGSDGALYLTDDLRGVIYRIAFTGS